MMLPSWDSRTIPRYFWTIPSAIHPDRWYRTWLYLADITEWSPFQMGTASSVTFCQKRIYRYADPSYVAADWIYDDHLHCRS